MCMWHLDGAIANISKQQQQKKNIGEQWIDGIVIKLILNNSIRAFSVDVWIETNWMFWWKQNESKTNRENLLPRMWLILKALNIVYA